MPIDDGSHGIDANDDQLPVEDLSEQIADAEAERVKGGIQITKHIDKASPGLLLATQDPGPRPAP